MVTIPVPPQSIVFPADFLSLPAVVSIQYSLASCGLSHGPALGNSSKKIVRCILNSFCYQVHTTDFSRSDKNAVPLFSWKSEIY